MMSNKNTETVELTLPLNAAYVSAARLTASSISNRLGFDIDEIEDIKVAVSEACTYIIKTYSSKTANPFQILFDITGKTLNFSLSLKTPVFVDSDNEDMGLIMIKALMDKFEINHKKDYVKIIMCKEHKQNSLEF